MSDANSYLISSKSADVVPLMVYIMQFSQVPSFPQILKLRKCIKVELFPGVQLSSHAFDKHQAERLRPKVRQSFASLLRTTAIWTDMMIRFDSTSGIVLKL